MRHYAVAQFVRRTFAHAAAERLDADTDLTKKNIALFVEKLIRR